MRGKVPLRFVFLACAALLLALPALGAPASSPQAAVAALHEAAARGDVLAVVTALDAGAPVDGPAPAGETALMRAARAGRPDVVRVLLARDARPELVAADGATARSCALLGGDAVVVRLIDAALAARPPAPAARAPRAPRAPEVPSAAPARPVIPPWSPDPLTLGLPDEQARFQTLLARIDQTLGDRSSAARPTFRPADAWVGEPFVFLPRDPGDRHEYPVFETVEALSAYRFEVSYASLAGRLGAVIRVGLLDGRRSVDIRLDGEPVVVRGYFSDGGAVHGVAPARDLAEARRRYLGQRARPRGEAVTRYRLDGRQLVRVLAIAPSGHAENPIRLLLETAGKRQLTMDAGLTATNVPLRQGRRRFVELANVLELDRP